jgi:hypothetical protein
VAKYTEQLDAQITQLLRTRGQATPDLIAGVTEEEARSFLSFYVTSHPERDLEFNGEILQWKPEAVRSAPEVRVSTNAPTSDGEAAGLAAAAAARSAATESQPADIPRGKAPARREGLPDVPEPETGGLDLEPASQAGFQRAGAVPSTTGGGLPPDQSPGYRGSSSGGYDPFDGLQPIPEPRTQAVSGWLWLLPLVFGLIGGIIAWAIARDKNPTTARTLLVAGIVIWIVSACLFFGMGSMLGGMAGTMGSAPTDTAWPATGQLTFYYFGTST